MNKLLTSLVLLFLCLNLQSQVASAKYPLDGNALDISGNNLNGNLNGNSSSTMNRFNQSGKAIALDGNGDYISLPQAFDFPNLTVVGWFKATSTGGTNTTTVIYSVDNASLQYGHQKFLLEDVSTFPQVRIQSGDVSYVKQITLNQWHQLAFTRTQSQVKIFIDGVLEYTSNSPGNYHSLSGVNYATIGAGYSLSNFLNGTVDDFLIYNVAIPDSQITNLYNSNCSLTTPASISPNGVVNICSGSSATLTASNGSSYLWNNSLTTQSISVNQAGNYIVTVTDANGCTGTASSNVNVNPLPTVTLSAPILINYYSSPATLIGSPINGSYSGPGVSGNSFNPNSAGLGLKAVTYTYTNVNNCSGSATTNILVYDTTGIVCSDTTHVTINDTNYISLSTVDTLIIDFTTSINPAVFNTLKVYPNPTSDYLFIDNGNLSSMSGYSVKIVNSIGQIMFNQPVTQQQFLINLSSWSGNGIYTLQIIDTQQNIKQQKQIVLQ